MTLADAVRIAMTLGLAAACILFPLLVGKVLMRAQARRRRRRIEAAHRTLAELVADLASMGYEVEDAGVEIEERGVGFYTKIRITASTPAITRG